MFFKVLDLKVSESIIIIMCSQSSNVSTVEQFTGSVPDNFSKRLQGFSKGKYL